MRLHISTKDPVPIYQQIITQVKHLVASQRLRPGDEVPPIRVLAEQLLINPNTVARAYRELESAGILTSKKGSGTKVSLKGNTLGLKERLKELSAPVDSLLVQAHQLGFTIEEVIEIVRERNSLFRALQKEKDQSDK